VAVETAATKTKPVGAGLQKSALADADFLPIDAVSTARLELLSVNQAAQSSS
jgi:hypothetical protein